MGCYPPCPTHSLPAPPLHHPQATTTFYRAEGERLMAELDVPAYLRHCEVRVGMCIRVFALAGARVGPTKLMVELRYCEVGGGCACCAAWLG